MSYPKFVDDKTMSMPQAITVTDAWMRRQAGAIVRLAGQVGKGERIGELEAEALARGTTGADWEASRQKFIIPIAGGFPFTFPMGLE